MPLPIVLAAIAAIAVLLIFLGLAGSGPVDPVQARLTQLGSMQAKNLEELELQAPFLERTLRPASQRLSAIVQRITSPAQAIAEESQWSKASSEAAKVMTVTEGREALREVGIDDSNLSNADINKYILEAQAAGVTLGNYMKSQGF